jgi:hypothetical protein
MKKKRARKRARLRLEPNRSSRTKKQLKLGVKRDAKAEKREKGSPIKNPVAKETYCHKHICSLASGVGKSLTENSWFFFRSVDRLVRDSVTSIFPMLGAVAQLAERVARIHEARGSNPLSSTFIFNYLARGPKPLFFLL